MPQCGEHGEMCMALGEIRGSLQEMSTTLNNVAEKVDHLNAINVADKGAEVWVWKQVKRWSLILSILAAGATTLYYVLKWAAC